MSAVHQFVPTLGGGAVGNHALELQRLLGSRGVDSEIFAAVFQPGFEHLGHEFRDYGREFRAGPEDVLVYQLAIGSVVGDFVRDRPETLIVNYHNLTPAHFFSGWDDSEIRGLAWGRVQLRALARTASLGLTVSRFNAAEMEGVGYRAVEIAPILLDLSSFDVGSDAQIESAIGTAKAKGGAELLFVGRVSPNKCHHDLIAALGVYRRLYDPLARLRLVGGTGFAAYADTLRRYAELLGLGDAVEITGSVSQSALNAYYRCADVFVCLSEHEGFCVPLLEAWHHGIPIVAFRAGAVPETLGDAGLLLPTKSPSIAAAAIDRVVTDRHLRDTLVDRGRTRLRVFSLEKTQEITLRAIGKVVDAIR